MKKHIPFPYLFRNPFIRFVAAVPLRFLASVVFVVRHRHGTPFVVQGTRAPRRGRTPSCFSGRSTFASSDATCWQYKGCYNETDSIHPLQFKILPSLTEDTNNENCQSACLAAGYLMSGTADAYNCWCDNKLNPKSNKPLESYCNVHCNTVASEACGG
jgi:hypothetical protein